MAAQVTVYSCASTGAPESREQGSQSALLWTLQCRRIAREARRDGLMVRLCLDLDFSRSHLGVTQESRRGDPGVIQLPGVLYL